MNVEDFPTDEEANNFVLLSDMSVPEFETKILRIIQAKLQSQLINKEDTLRKSEDKPQIETRRLVANEVWTLVHYGKMVAAFAAFSFMFLLQKCRPDDIL